MAGILDFLSNGIFLSGVEVDENSCRWSTSLITKLNRFTGALLNNSIYTNLNSRKLRGYYVTLALDFFGKLLGTVFAFFACIVFGKELLGDHIHCISVNEESHISEASFNSYCYIRNFYITYLITFTGDRIASRESAYFGVKPMQAGEDPVYHSYYQWIPYLFFIQAITFFAPYNMYKFSLDGRISHLIQNLNNVIPFNENRDDKLGDIHLYLQDYYNSHCWWARKLFISDFMNLVNVVTNIILINWYMGQNFLTYGWKLIQYNILESTHSPAELVFPKMTKCTMNLYGASGTLQNYDALCVMPVNMLNEKLFFILWLILLPLAFITVLDQMFSFALFFSKIIRNAYLVSFVLPHFPSRRKRLAGILKHLKYGDWLVLYLVARNIDRALFSALAEVIHRPGVGYYPDEEGEEQEKGSRESLNK